MSEFDRLFKNVGRVVEDVGHAIGDAVEWVGDQLEDIWDSKLGKIVVIAAAVYFGGWALAGGFGGDGEADKAFEIADNVDTTKSQGFEELQHDNNSEASLLDSSTSNSESLTDIGVLDEITAAKNAGLDPSPYPTVSQLNNIPTGNSEPIIKQKEEQSWAEKNPTLAYGGISALGQLIGGYATGEQQKDIEEQRLKEEQEKRDRKNYYGVNYKEGGQGIRSGDKLRELNRKYFDSNNPQARRQEEFEILSERRKNGVLDDVKNSANPNKYDHRS